MSFEMLSDFNWSSWKFRMELLLLKEELWDTVKNVKPENANAAWLAKDAKARATIGLTLENNQLCHVLNVATAHEMWEALKGYHERSSLTNIIHVLRKLYSLRLAEGESMSEHLGAIAQLVHRLSGMGENLAEHLIIALVLSSLPASYSAMISVLESRDNLTLNYVKGQLLDEWRRRSDNNSDGNVSSEKVLQTGTKPKNSVKSKVCHYCKREGHFRRDCKKFAADQARKRDAPKYERQQKAKVCQEETDEFCFTVCNGDSGGLWYLDSGASAHMTNDAKNLVDLEESKNGEVCLADGKKLPAGGSGTGKFLALNESGEKKTITLKKVLYVPELASNLLSVGKITDEGFEVLFTQSDCRIMKNGHTVLFGERRGGLYNLKQPKYQSLLSMVPHTDCCQHLWHRRLGHRHPDAVKRIVTEDLGDGLKLRDCGVRSVCTVCCEGKLVRKPFPKASETKSSAVLDLVHTDLAGPLEVNTPRGNRFIMTMIDDYSKYTIIYLLKHKSEAFDKIREYVSFVHNKFGYKPKVLRCDGGGEYSSTGLLKFMKEAGITLQQTAPYSPQQNGTAERKNRSLLEMMRCLLSEAKIDSKYWGEAVSCANYLLNRLPAATISCTPYELWHGSKPKYNHLRVFGSHAFVHIPEQKRQKLDKKAVRMIFVGYEENRKAYRFLDESTNRICISRDAVFLENELKVQESVRGIEMPKEGEMSSAGVDLTAGSTEADHNFENQQNEEIQDSDDELDNTAVPEMNESSYDSATDLLGESNNEIFKGFSEDEYLRRSQRATKGNLPARYRDQANAVQEEVELEPRNVKEAKISKNSSAWQKAMEAEMKSHKENGTWELTPLPKGRKAVGSRWVYKIKRDATGNVTRYKARLVAQGYSQQYGVDFDEVFAPVTNHATFRSLLAIASMHQIALKHLDVRTAYLHGDLEEEVFMKQPPGFEESGQEHLVCRLRKSIYGLKQSARCWNRKLHEALIKMRFKQSQSDPCLYMKIVDGNIVYILIYVDDIVVGCKDDYQTAKVYESLKEHFDVANLGDLSFFLGMQIERKDGNYSISLSGYIDQVADRFGMKDAKPAKTPMDSGFLKLNGGDPPFEDTTKYRSLIGALLYIAVHARPDISISTSILGRRVCSPSAADWVAAKRIIRYLLGTKDWKLQFTGTGGDLIGYCDADWAGDQESRKSTSGFCFLLGGAAISWTSRRQSSVTLSSMEAEYTSLSEACREAVWLRKLLYEMGSIQKTATVIHEDNQGCIAFVHSERVTKRSKHIETREHFVKELCERNEIKLVYCSTEEMFADILTKPLGTLKQRKFAKMIGMTSVPV